MSIAHSLPCTWPKSTRAPDWRNLSVVHQANMPCFHLNQLRSRLCHFPSSLLPLWASGGLRLFLFPLEVQKENQSSKQQKQKDSQGQAPKSSAGHTAAPTLANARSFHRGWLTQATKQPPCSGCLGGQRDAGGFHGPPTSELEDI